MAFILYDNICGVTRVQYQRSTRAYTVTRDDGRSCTALVDITTNNALVKTIIISFLGYTRETNDIARAHNIPMIRREIDRNYTRSFYV